jgi:hypothetical protein
MIFRKFRRQGNVQNLHIANSDKPVEFYSLDVIKCKNMLTDRF